MRVGLGRLVTGALVASRQLPSGDTLTIAVSVVVPADTVARVREGAVEVCPGRSTTEPTLHMSLAVVPVRRRTRISDRCAGRSRRW